MKILHTADWHIGKKLHKVDLHQDFSLFVDWLCEVIQNENIDVLLVSGDIFDFSNPSSESRTLYYQTLMKLKKFNLKIILTGGNHDSPNVLDAPKELLNQLDIHVIGRMPENVEDCLIPILKNNEVEIVVAAIPYLRSQDLKKQYKAEDYDSKIEAIQHSIAYHFQETAKVSKTKFPDKPLLGMGHLYAVGVALSDSERDIQIGNLAGLEAKHFGNLYDYIALGHIHKPQKLNAKTPIFYSGSPIPLSFSERKNDKRILIIDTETDFEPQSLSVPKFRNLKLIKGNLDDIRTKLEQVENSEELDTLIEIQMQDIDFSATKNAELESLIENFSTENCKIVKHKISYQNQPKGSADLYKSEDNIQDLNVSDVFRKKLDATDETEVSKIELIDAFESILDELNIY
ncbi:exonuclease subunit SbcD [Psychroflexus aestuariivivens]|uniref:exonuclease subunit SbcD n=1 Tax=Psychroflexus aestuariivivens TaxID=1795040 RepID=UPI000FDC280E|nr:exonuclease subunit SbcD [Psychroflexus aestuariivivens]